MTDTAPKLHAVTAETLPVAIVNATNKDTARATRVMQDQLKKIIAGLERELYEAQEVRNMVTKRIIDLHTAINAARASIEAMNNHG